jgi:hypothetical protein
MSLLEDRKCEWCKGPIPATARADAKTCKKSCRQQLQRYRVAPADSAAGASPLHFGYADPPYPGLADRYYSADERCAEVDHVELVRRLAAEFPAGWALSTSSAALEEVLCICREVLGRNQVRTAMWHKGPRSGVAYRARDAFEPVILFGGRPSKLGPRDKLENVLVWGGRQHSHPDALVGMKPAPFCEWLFRMLGALAGDFLTDLFPGSGSVMRAWLMYGGRDPNEQPPTLRLPFADLVTAPPIQNRLASTTSRLDEAGTRSTIGEPPQVERATRPPRDAGAVRQLALGVEGE